MRIEDYTISVPRLSLREVVERDSFNRDDKDEAYNLLSCRGVPICAGSIM